MAPPSPSLRRPSAAAAPAAAQITVSESDEVRAGELAVPLNKSQVLRSDRPFAKALIGNPEIADVLPLTDSSLYVLGKKMGTTSLTLYDRNNRLIAVIDIAVGPDVIGLKRQLSELMPNDQVGARISNDSVILEGVVSSGPSADKAVQVAGILCSWQGHQPAVDRFGAAGDARGPLLRDQARRAQGPRVQRFRHRQRR